MPTRLLRGHFSTAALFVLVWSLLCGPAFGAGTAEFTVSLPLGWNQVDGTGTRRIPEQVRRIFDGADAGAAQLHALGWKEEGGKVLGAYAITYVPSGMGELTARLAAAPDGDREALATRFADVQAEKIRVAYEEKRSMKVADCSIDVLGAQSLYVVVIEAMIRDGRSDRVRSSTLFLRGDSLLGVTFIHDRNAPDPVVRQLDALATSVAWQ